MTTPKNDTENAPKNAHETAPDDYTEYNRQAWNEVMPIHRRGRKVDLRQAVTQPDFNDLDEVAGQLFRSVGLAGKRLAHLCCNNGVELISLLKMAAAEGGQASGVGFDISDAAIEEAQELAALAGVEAQFVRTDALQIPASRVEAGSFDIAFFTIGALTWIQDLERLFHAAAWLLRPGGSLLIYEAHPVLDMMTCRDEPEYDPDNELKIAFPYFNSEPWVSNSGIDYVGDTVYEGKTNYCFSHPLSEIINALAHNGFLILEMCEYPHDISASFRHLEKYRKLPMCYTLAARKLSLIF